MERIDGKVHCKIAKNWSNFAKPMPDIKAVAVIICTKGFMNEDHVLYLLHEEKISA